MTALVYINTAEQAGDSEHARVFATVKWFEEKDPKGAAFEYAVLE